MKSPRKIEPAHCILIATNKPLQSALCEVPFFLYFSETYRKGPKMNALLLNRKVFMVEPRNIRNGIIKTVRTQMPGTPFAKPLIEHLEKCGKRAFDKYCDIELILEEYNVVLRFRTGVETGEEMSYRLDKLTLEPNPEFAKKWTDVFRF